MAGEEEQMAYSVWHEQPTSLVKRISYSARDQS
jgi:hypothetical protein